MEELKFQKLTPTDDVDLSGYEDGFKFVFGNEDICNVAISGPYSSGKSSVLETYKKHNGEKKFIHVFLAHFSSTVGDSLQESRKQDIVSDENALATETKTSASNNFDNKRSSENTIEGKILNQLIQQIPADDIPHTNFHVKREIKKSHFVIMTTGIVCIFLSLLFFIYGDAWRFWVASINTAWIRKFFNVTLTHGFQFMTGLVTIVTFFVGIYKILMTQANKTVFKKLSIQGNEIEIFSDSEDSYFDKYLNEVLYLLERVDADAIVFEDIDRFNEIQIFERLREINTLANIRRKRLKEKKRELKFFYLLRDDIFITKERTKFFDYIMPVVPVVTGSNSYNKLKEYLQGTGLFDKFNNYFLRDLCLYIDDLRLVKNIVNEFVIFDSKLKGIDLDNNKLLAMITYKNIFPQDYADLQLRKGFVYAVFNAREDMIAKEKEKCEIDIIKLEKRIDLIDSEISTDVAELDTIKDMKRNKAGSATNKGYKEWLENDYVHRKQAIEDRHNMVKQSLREELRQLKAKRNGIDNYTVAKIIECNPDTDIFKITTTSETGRVNDYNEIKDSDYFELLKFLISDGYIDETYNDYLTFFYTNDISANDKRFLRSVTDRMKKGYEYRLDNVQLVLDSLEPPRFRQKEILNFDLIEFLLRKDEKRIYLSPFVMQLRESCNYDFIVSFFDANRERIRFVILLNDLWPEFFSVICELNNTGLRSIQKDFSYISIMKCEEPTLKRVNNNGALAKYVSSQSDYLNINLDSERIGAFVASLSIINVKFERIERERSNRSLLEEVYECNLYKINAENLRLFMLLKYKRFDYDLDFSKSMTIIKTKADEPLLNYMVREPELALQAILEVTEEKLNDDEDIEIFILNNEEISVELRKQYLLRCTTKINRMSDIQKIDFHKILMNNELLVYSIDNIFLYYAESGWTPELEKFLDTSTEKLDYKAVSFTAPQRKQYFMAAVKSANISEFRFSEIVRQLGEKIATLNDRWPERNVIILAREKLITMSKANLDFVRKNYPGVLRIFITSDFETYISVLGNTYKKSEVEEIFKWEEISTEKKLLLLRKRQNEKYTALCLSYPDEVLLEILEKHRQENELSELYRQYGNYSPLVKEKIYSLAKSRISGIIQTGGDLNFELLTKLLESRSLDFKTRIELAQKYIKNLGEDKQRSIITSLGGKDIAHALLPHKTKSVPNTSENALILDMIKQTGVIRSYAKDEDRDTYRLKK